MKRHKLKKNTARNVALTSLGIAEKTEKNFDVILHTLFKQLRVPPREKALAYEITCGVIRRRITLDYVIAKYSKTPIQRMHPVLKNILRIALYQLLFLSGSPDYAVVDEANKQARVHLYPGAAGFAKVIAAEPQNASTHALCGGSVSTIRRARRCLAP